MRVPIACTLQPEAATGRIAEWRSALRTSVDAATRPSPRRVELRLVEDPAAVGQLVDLARREKGCCGFFTFTVEIDAEGATMVVEVPEDAAPVLDDFATLMPHDPGAAAGPR